MNKIASLVPYWILNFTIGFGWFSLAPLVPNLMGQYSFSDPSPIILLISLYGYAMVVVALISGYLSSKFSVSHILMLAAVISSVGLFLRAFSSTYDFLLVAQIVAAIAYPLAVAPVGAIAQSINPKKSHTIVGVSIGVLFLGMSAGSFVTPTLYLALGGVHNVFVFIAALSLIALAALPLVYKSYPKDYTGKSLKGSVKLGMFKNWYIGLAISSLSVMFGSIAASELLAKSFSTALELSGSLSGLAFLGSALGAIILPPLFESLGKVRAGMVLTSLVSFLSIVLLAYYLAYTTESSILMLSYFLFGFFGNAFWSMALTSTTKYVKDPAQAGLSTSMYSMATNLGVAFIPTFLGPYFLSNALQGVAVVSGMVAVGFLMSFFLKVRIGGEEKEVSAGTPA